MVKNDFLVRPTFPPKANCFIKELLSASTSLILRPQEKTKEEQDKRRQEEDKTRSQSPTELRGAASQCVQGWSARPEDRTRTRGGQDPPTGPQSPTEFRGAAKIRTRGGQGPDTEPGAQSPATEFRGAASQCGQLFFSKIEPQQ